VRFLIDTHTFIWFVDGDLRLSTPARTIIEDGSHEIMLSVASLWEMAIKVGLGRLSVAASSRLPFATAVQQQLAANNIIVLLIKPEHALAVSALPQNTGHNDPFDRLLAVQAMMEHVPLISADTRLDSYGVTRIW
jgi:PIN domain nuclease of toxin-antitoxin system